VSKWHSFSTSLPPETWQGFRAHGASVSGFRERQLATADRIKPGDTFLCYVARLCRWCGALEIISPAFMDATPIFSDPDPFIVRVTRMVESAMSVMPPERLIGVQLTGMGGADVVLPARGIPNQLLSWLAPATAMRSSTEARYGSR
jgi:hypothetical protein